MNPLIELKDVTVKFKVGKNEITVLDEVSLSLERGEIYCLVGESGCGKTTTGKVITGLLGPTSGQVLYQGRDVTRQSKEEHKKYRLGVQIVHQDPYASLNPTHSIFDIIAAPLQRHRLVRSDQEAERKVNELLRLVDLTPPEDFIHKFPHQLSGGQRQRVSVARAVSVQPSLIVADEAVSMVDISIRISLLRMMMNLRDELGTAFVLITHDLALAKFFAGSGRIGVMYLGKLVEETTAADLVKNPRHPYTRALISAIPEADPEVTRTKERFELRSLDVPSLLHRPGGCAFHPRCPLIIDGLCDRVPPSLEPVDGTGKVSCHLFSHPMRKEKPIGQETEIEAS